MPDIENLNTRIEQLVNVFRNSGVPAEEAISIVEQLHQTIVKSSLNLLGPETPGTTEIPNQNKPFDFLEQNAYEEADSGWITPLDSI